MWTSLKGTSSDKNGDFGGVIENKNHSIYFIFDSMPGPKRTNNTQINIIEESSRIFKNAIEVCDYEYITMLNNMHKNLRTKFIHDKFCYAMLFISKKRSWGLSCGDCIVGKECGGEITDFHEKDSIGDSLVTRCWKPREFKRPRNFDVEVNSNIILATDGYWSDHKIKGMPIGETIDDCSFLNVRPEHPLTGENFIYLNNL